MLCFHKQTNWAVLNLTRGDQRPLKVGMHATPPHVLLTMKAPAHCRLNAPATCALPSQNSTLPLPLLLFSRTLYDSRTPAMRNRAFAREARKTCQRFQKRPVRIGGKLWASIHWKGFWNGLERFHRLGILPLIFKLLWVMDVEGKGSSHSELRDIQSQLISHRASQNSMLRSLCMSVSYWERGPLQ